MEGNHICVSLNKVTFLLPGNCLLGLIYSVQDLVLYINLALWRVDIFCNLLVSPELAAAKGYYLAADAPYREHHPLVEAVQKLAVFPLNGKANLNQVLFLVSFPLGVVGKLPPLVWGVAQKEFVYCLICKAALLEVAQSNGYPFI